jgi:hypothetical protein
MLFPSCPLSSYISGYFQSILLYVSFFILQTYVFPLLSQD